MENNTTVSAKVSDTFDALEKAILRFNQAQFNVKPHPEGWSPAMVSQHIILSSKGLDQVLLGPTQPTEGQADEKVEKIKSIFLDFTAKYNAPPYIQPQPVEYEQSQQLAQLKSIANAVSSVLPNLDLTETCLDFQFPSMGHLTRFELLNFLIYHTQRHTHQLNKMEDAL